MVQQFHVQEQSIRPRRRSPSCECYDPLVDTELPLSFQKVYRPSKRRFLGHESESSSGPNIEMPKSALIAGTANFIMKDGSSIRISRHVLMEVPYFSTLLSQEPDRLSYGLPEDEPHAMRILMSILHHKPSQLPVALSTKHLFDLATISSKYNFTDIISAHVECRPWICKLWGDDKPQDEELGTWLWILHIFHTTKQNSWRYKRVLEILAANMIYQNEEDCWILGRHEHRLQFLRIESAAHREVINGKHSHRSMNELC
jgi:hypothetical protein